MPRKTITVGNTRATPIEGDDIQKTLFLVQVGSTSTGYTLDFTNGSITYFDVEIRQSFEYVLVDNIGDGEVRVAFNRKGMDLTSAINGAKTLKSLDSLYIQDSIETLSMYFIGASTLELVLISS